MAGAAVANAAAELSQLAQGTPDDGKPPTALSNDCGGEYVIDDIADADNQIMVQDGRTGHWFTFVDTAGTTISPPAGHRFIQSTGGAHGLQHAARMLGKVSSSEGPLYGAMGFNFSNPRAVYDASKYTGVSFYAKAGVRSQTVIRVSVPDVNTDPDGRICTLCRNHFGVNLELTHQWKRFSIPFAQMAQLEGWGSPQKDHVDKTKLYGIEWEVNKAAASYDIWVSDVQFTGCP